MKQKASSLFILGMAMMLSVYPFYDRVAARDVSSPGGEIGVFSQRVKRARASGELMRLHRCDSACTMFLSANACVYPDSRLGFHRTFWIDDRGREIFDDSGRRYDAMMWSHYPPGVKRLLGGLTSRLVYLTGRQLIAAGVKKCR
jgi:hypothetical protein